MTYDCLGRTCVLLVSPREDVVTDVFRIYIVNHLRQICQSLHSFSEISKGFPRERISEAVEVSILTAEPHLFQDGAGAIRESPFEFLTNSLISCEDF